MFRPRCSVGSTQKVCLSRTLLNVSSPNLHRSVVHPQGFNPKPDSSITNMNNGFDELCCVAVFLDPMCVRVEQHCHQGLHKQVHGNSKSSLFFLLQLCAKDEEEHHNLPPPMDTRCCLPLSCSTATPAPRHKKMAKVSHWETLML